MSDVIKAVLFDFGGVFTDSPFHAVNDFGVELGVDPERITDIVFGSYENDGDHPWHQLERGEISLEVSRELILGRGREHGLEIDIYTLFMKMAQSNAGAGARSALVDRVRKLKADGYPTGLVTNNVAEFGEGWRGLIPVDELFDFVVDSSAVGVRKPNPKIFQLAIDHLDNINSEHTLFLDDYQANVEAAQAFGMQSMLVTTDLNATIQQLDELLDTKD